MTKDIKKISLPIEEITEATPNNPAWKWLKNSILIAIAIIGIGFIFHKILTVIIINHLDIETEKKIFGEIMVSEYEFILDARNFESVKNHENKEELTTGIEKIFIENNPIENAFAMLGANIVVTSGLLEKAKTEEEIIFILGHERTHIENRDVVNSLASSIPLVIVMEMMGISGGIVGVSPDDLILSKISRDAEYKADEGGKLLLEKLELNTECATRFFEAHSSTFEKYSEWNSTHPDTNIRLMKLRENNPFKDKPCHEFDYKSFKEKFLQKTETENTTEM